MSIERMADRALPLTERVEAACLLDWDKDNADGRWDARDVLIADIAAADRLARACLPHETDDDPADDQKAYEDSCQEWIAALAAYRARMAQGVGDG